jgi:ferredoxin
VVDSAPARRGVVLIGFEGQKVPKGGVLNGGQGARARARAPGAMKVSLKTVTPSKMPLFSRLRALYALPRHPISVSSRVVSRTHCDGPLKPGARPVTLTFLKKGVETRCTGLEGENLVHLAHANNVELEGACECSLACSTCHVILPPAVFDALPAAGEEEEDLLDLAFGLTPTCVPLFGTLFFI